MGTLLRCDPGTISGQSVSSHLRNLSTDVIKYGVGSAALSAVSFVLLPIYTHYLTPADYGRLTLLGVSQAVIEIVAGCGITSGLFRYYLMAKTPAQRQVLLSTSIWLQLAIVATLSGVLLLLAGSFSAALLGTGQMRFAWQLVSITALVNTASSLSLALLRAERRAWQFAALQLGGAAVSSAVGIVLLAGLHRGFMGVAYGNLAGSAVMACFLVPMLVGRGTFAFSWPLAKKLALFCAPILMVNLSNLVLSFGDRVFLTHFVSVHEVGVYSVGAKLAGGIKALLIGPFSVAFAPYVLSVASTGQFKAVISRGIKYFCLCVTLISLFIALFSREVVLFAAGPPYSVAHRVVGLLLTAEILKGLTYNISVVFDVVEKTYFYSLVIVAGGLVNLLGNFYLIPVLGMAGAALAGCLAALVMTSITYALSQRCIRIDYQLRTFAVIMALACVCVVASAAIGSIFTGLATAVAAKSALIVGVCAAAIRLGILDHPELDFLSGLPGRLRATAKSFAATGV